MSLLQFFEDHYVNKFGATLVYSTHYPELLDYLKRNDSIYIVKKNSDISIDKISKYMNRSDMNRSTHIIRGLLEKTAPSYTSFNNLCKLIQSNIENHSKISE